MTSAAYSSTPPHIAPRMFDANAASASGVSRKDPVNTRFAKKIGANAMADASR